ncbi:hypothetical protein P4E94_07905 [Pontiellaceae bacterium B12219]|nr:hypothetical protein [Pontiellaceae bacterium B12219]
MKKSILELSILALLLNIPPLETEAQFIIRQDDAAGKIRTHKLLVPYFFSTDVLDFGIGVGGSYNSENNPETTYFGTAYATENGSWLTLLGGYNIRVPKTERFYIRPHASLGRYTQMRLYVQGNPDYAGLPPAGSNGSSANNYIEVNEQEAIVNLEMRYTLPLGNYAENALHTYIVKEGRLVENPSGAESWNPLQSGKTTLVLTPYYQQQYTDVIGVETLNFRAGMEYDNTDFIPNPHRGYKVTAGYTYDPDWLSDTRQWNMVDGQIDGYIPLPDTSWTRQQTIALSWWSAYSPSYDSGSADFSDRPPYFAGPTLGGLWRMRAYPSYRFHDKAAIYYTAEYRIMPEWQPFGKISWLKPLHIRWWQMVLVGEAGRVAPTWNFETLHSDMKYDFGIGFRGMFNTGVARIDFMASPEGMTVAAMFGQSF